MPVAEIKINALTGGLRKRNRSKHSANPQRNEQPFCADDARLTLYSPTISWNADRRGPPGRIVQPQNPAQRIQGRVAPHPERKSKNDSIIRLSCYLPRFLPLCSREADCRTSGSAPQAPRGRLSSRWWCLSLLFAWCRTLFTFSPNDSRT